MFCDAKNTQKKFNKFWRFLKLYDYSQFLSFNFNSYFAAPTKTIINEFS